MKSGKDTSIISDGYSPRIFGLPERMIYMVGVVMFYVLLFFTVTMISSKMPSVQSTATEINKTE